MRLPTDVAGRADGDDRVPLGRRRLVARRRRWSPRCWRIAAPRLFFDAQLATFDAPIAAHVGRRRLRLLARARRQALGLAHGRPASAWRSPPSSTASSFRRAGCRISLFVAWQRRRLPPLRRVHLHGDARRRWCFSPAGRGCGSTRCIASANTSRSTFTTSITIWSISGTNYNKPPFPLSFPYVMDGADAAGDDAGAGARRRGPLVRDWWRARGAPARRRAPTRRRSSTRAPPGCSWGSTRSSRWPSSPSRARPSSAPPSTSTPRFRSSRCWRDMPYHALWQRARSEAPLGGARVRRARLPARRRRDLARAPVRAHALQPPRRRPAGRRRPRHEPPVLGLRDARHPAVDQRARAPGRARLLARHQPVPAQHGRARGAAARRHLQYAGSKSPASRRAISPWSFTKSISTNTNIGSGTSTAPPARRWCSTTKASPSSPSTSAPDAGHHEAFAHHQARLGGLRDLLRRLLRRLGQPPAAPLRR